MEEKDIPVNTKVDKKWLQLSRYEASSVRIAKDEIAVKYVKDNIQKIWKEKPVYQHGDFHPGNLIYMENGEIGVIDFNRWEVGDPYEEFYKLESFARELSVPYCIGQIQAYFNDEVPEDFWSILAVYVAHASLFSIKWAEKFGQSDIDGMLERCKVAFEDYDYFKRNIPVWYKEKELFNMKNKVGEANKNDLDEILGLYLYLHEKSIPEDSQELRNTWDDIINDNNHHLIVCEVDGKLVASCVCVIIPNLTRNVRPYAFVENVVTHGDYRKKGYATACLNFAKQIAKKNNCYKMMLLTGSKEESTLNFYLNAGYNSSDKTAFIQWIDM